MRYTVVLDTMGSDNGAAVLVKGAGLAIEKNEDLDIILVGNSEEILAACCENNIPADRYEIVHTDEVITNYDSAAAVLFEKPNSSLAVALKTTAERDDVVGIVNAGNTGALMTGALKHLSGESRVRPALAAILPAENGGFVCLVDTGATIDCTPQMLVHFAHLGSDFMKNMYKLEAPRVGLLSNGAEKTKGNKVVKETHALLEGCDDLNFVGNIEGNNALSGACDVLVCDGFAGNQVLKVTEGTAKRIITDVVKIAKTTGNKEYMALAGQLMAKYDLSSLGGGIILGAKKSVIKARGSSNELSIMNTIGIVLNLAKNKNVYNTENT